MPFCAWDHCIFFGFGDIASSTQGLLLALFRISTSGFRGPYGMLGVANTVLYHSSPWVHKFYVVFRDYS